ncbi:hypothetical protein PC113_g6310 [Phytophthora cactorum]|uniref:Malic enzyme NAD-binding domain-containing protein n=1 Tax=Phytophthora cactorum TaxID=29920 RepID=A0A8T0ZJF7_9STRA|nr:hypothetical protein PC113_g6310 [Phytophthora cactorum]
MGKLYNLSRRHETKLDLSGGKTECVPKDPAEFPNTEEYPGQYDGASGPISAELACAESPPELFQFATRVLEGRRKRDERELRAQVRGKKGVKVLWPDECIGLLLESVEESRKPIWRVDSRGLVVESRKESLQPHKLPYAHDVPECSNLVETLDRIKPTALIGVCTIAKAFNEEVCQKMNELNEHPIIFALSNSASKAECTAEEAYTFTNGNFIFASGSPFDPVEINGKLCVPGQGNNSYIFPGVGLGVVAAGLTHVNNEIMIIAAKTLAGLTTPADLETGCVYPQLSSIQEVSLKIAEAVAEYGYEQGFATVPKPENMTQYLRDFIQFWLLRLGMHCAVLPVYIPLLFIPPSLQFWRPAFIRHWYLGLQEEGRYLTEGCKARSYGLKIFKLGILTHPSQSRSNRGMIGFL